MGESGLRPDFSHIPSFTMPSQIIIKMAQSVSGYFSRTRIALRSARELREDVRCLRRIIRSEPEPGRPILELYFLERCSVDDIASRLGISPAMVRRHLLRVIRRFEEERSS